jgi:high-affinity iron transporter
MNKLYLRLFILSLNKKMTIKNLIRPLCCFAYILIFGFTTHAASPGANNEGARVLVNTLSYMSTDYPNGIAGGKVINKAEYEEMLGFCSSALHYYHDNVPSWSPVDTLKIGTLIYHLDSLIHAHAPVEAVQVTANSAIAEVIRASGLTVSPTKYPNLLNGKAVYAANCANCHGDKGFGDGKAGIKLDPRPRNFHDDERMSLLSPFAVYNTVKCGVQGTGMMAHPEIPDDQVWDVAFYVLSLRYGPPADRGYADQVLKNKFPSITLEQIATRSDKELAAAYHSDKNDLAILRYDQPDNTKGQFIDAALKYIDESMAASREGRYDEAERLSTMAYLEGIEPIENQLRSTDPALIQRIEEQMGNTRRALSAHQPLPQVNDSLKESKRLILEAGKLISATVMTPWLAMFMAMTILLREGLEAFLVIMVILGVIRASGVSSPARYVHAGWITAILSGVVMWIIFGQIIRAHKAQVELMEGVIAFLAVAMLLYIGFWLHGKSEITKWKAYVTGKIKNISGANSLIGLFALSFFVAFREVFESVMFLWFINIQADGKLEKAIIAGVVIAFVIVIAMAWLLLRFSARLPIPKLFKISSIVMGALAVVLAGNGIHSFQEAGHSSIHGISFMPRVELFELFGIFPTVETLVAQITVLAIVVYVMKYANRVKPA